MTTAVAGKIPTAADLSRWESADQAHRPDRLAGLRERMAGEGVGAYFGVRRENTRYLTGFVLQEGEEKGAGNSGQFLISPDDVVVLADSRYFIQVGEQCPDARMEKVYNTFPERWPELLASVGSPRRVAMEAGFISQAQWQSLAAAAPDVELVAANNWIETLRQVKTPDEIERVAAACAVADAALERLLSTLMPGMTEREVALALEWEMRTGGAEALAFGVTCLSGPRAALPHGHPGERRLASGEVLLFDFGAQVSGYRSDMTRTLFVGEPSSRDLEIYDLVARAQQAAMDALTDVLAAGGPLPSGRALHIVARDVIAAAGHGDHFGHGLGHGIGLATHELPGLGMSAADTPLPTPTVFTIEPGVYLEGEMGVRIEDTLAFDAAGGRFDRLTLFPREVTVVG
ncbi:MAG: Xaa-Pro peptidase family protein [Chloroflexota bacterium]